MHLLLHTQGLRINDVDQRSISGGQVGPLLRLRPPQSPGDHIGVVIAMRKSLHLLSQGEVLIEAKKLKKQPKVLIIFC